MEKNLSLKQLIAIDKLKKAVIKSQVKQNQAKLAKLLKNIPLCIDCAFNYSKFCTNCIFHSNFKREENIEK